MNWMSGATSTKRCGCYKRWTGELCPVDWKPGQSTLTTYDEWLAKALPRLPKQVLVDATKKLQTIKYSAGQMVFEQGDAPDRFYIISSGEVEVIRRKRDGSEKILAVLHPGDYFGEIGLLTEARRNASIRAKTNVELLAMSWDDRSEEHTSELQSHSGI